MNKKTLRDISVSGKRVLVRVDFNVPLKEGIVKDDTRIVKALDTIRHIVDNGGKAILMSHLGRPKGDNNAEFTLKPVAEKLSALIGKPVDFVDELVGDKATEAVNCMQNGNILVLENTRFEKGETKNDPELAKKIALMGDVHVNDAFGTAHRAHASNCGVAEHLESVAGFLLEKEIEYLGNALSSPKKPFVAVLGGAKVSDKIGVIENLLKICDKLIIGGGMMFTFLKAQGKNVGTSLLEEDKIELATRLLSEAKDKILLPVDTIIAKEFNETSESMTVSVDNIPDGFMGLDIGPESSKLFAEAIKTAKTVIWNGPMGVFEMKKFEEGTLNVARAIAEADCMSVVGGGDSVSAVNKLGYADKMSHISTGGGASLEMMEGKPMPGIESLKDK